MLHVVLFEPDIPQNTGNVGRMCAYSGSRLHLIHPLGFTITDRHLRRSGMDYWRDIDLVEHDDWRAFMASPKAPQRLWLMTAQGEQSLWDVSFADGDGLVFGKESTGSPEWLHRFAIDSRVAVPRFDDRLRSLNLATCAGIATYEALRQVQRPRA